MNNKRLGTEFEREVCNLLRKGGWWAHFMTPDASGAQPFDIIAVRYGIAVAIDCKTSIKRIFPITRLEDNQIYAFDRWLECGNSVPFIMVKYYGKIYMVQYTDLKDKGKVDLEECEVWSE